MVGLQAVATLLVATLVLVWSVDEAVPALVGGVVAFLPNAYFAWAATLAGRYEASSGALAGAWLLGQWVVKMALTVALLVVAFVVVGVGGVGFFIGLGAALAAMFAAPLVAAEEPTKAVGGRKTGEEGAHRT